ncbi:uncharacterized protein [Ptychodera flava]|uniref:uncharacterized protein isoform X2 n=1 Tax=Ptychodera flava TaxID=63121 RepID=UPI003969C98B
MGYSSSLVRVSDSHLLMISLYARKRDNASSQWFTDRHFKEALALLRGSVSQYVQEFINKTPKTNIRQKKEVCLPETPKEATGTLVKVKYHFAKRHFNNTCLMPENLFDINTLEQHKDISYTNFHILAHKVVVNVYQLNSAGSQHISSVTNLEANSDRSDYFNKTTASGIANSNVRIKSAKRKQSKLKNIVKRHQETPQSTILSLRSFDGGFLKESESNIEDKTKSDSGVSSSEENSVTAEDERVSLSADTLARDDRQTDVCGKNYKYHKGNYPLMSSSKTSEDKKDIKNLQNDENESVSHHSVTDFGWMNEQTSANAAVKINKLSRKQQKQKRFGKECAHDDVLTINNVNRAADSSSEEKTDGSEEILRTSCHSNQSDCKFASSRLQKTKVLEGYDNTDDSFDVKRVFLLREKFIFNQFSDDAIDNTDKKPGASFRNTCGNPAAEDTAQCTFQSVSGVICGRRTHGLELKEFGTSHSSIQLTHDKFSALQSQQQLDRPVLDEEMKSIQKRESYKQLLSFMSSDSDKDENENSKSQCSPEPVCSVYSFQNISQESQVTKSMETQVDTSSKNDGKTSRKRKGSTCAVTRQAKLIKVGSNKVLHIGDPRTKARDVSEAERLTSSSQQSVGQSPPSCFESRCVDQADDIQLIESEDFEDLDDSCTIVTSKSTARKASYEMYVQQMVQNIQGIRDIKDLNEEEIKFLIRKNEEYFRDIFQGKTHSWRHEDYKKGGNRRVNLTYRVYMTIFIFAVNLTYRVYMTIFIFAVNLTYRVYMTIFIIAVNLTYRVYMTIFIIAVNLTYRVYMTIFIIAVNLTYRVYMTIFIFAVNLTYRVYMTIFIFAVNLTYRVYMTIFIFAVNLTYRVYMTIFIFAVNLTYRVYMTIFSEEQQEAVIQALTDMFCSKHNKYLDYVLKVMLAEAFIKIFMDIHQTTHEESEEIMRDHLKQPASPQ